MGHKYRSYHKRKAQDQTIPYEQKPSLNEEVKRKERKIAWNVILKRG